jgi:hypothetical protein
MRVGCTGHQNLPEQAIEPIRRMLLEALSAERHSLTGVMSLAEGADQLFATLVLERGGGLHVVVPSLHYEDSFETTAGAERFKALLAEAISIETLPYAEPSERAFLDAGRRVVDLSDLLVAVWDGEPARGKGGTADIVAYARTRNVSVRVVWPPGLSR